MRSLIFMVQSAGFECLSAHSSTNGFAQQEMSVAADSWKHIWLTSVFMAPAVCSYLFLFFLFYSLFILLAFILEKNEMTFGMN